MNWIIRHLVWLSHIEIVLQAKGILLVLKTNIPGQLYNHRCLLPDICITRPSEAMAQTVHDEDFNYLCHPRVAKWWKTQIYYYIPTINSARQMLIIRKGLSGNFTDRTRAMWILTWSHLRSCFSNRSIIDDLSIKGLCGDKGISKYRFGCHSIMNIHVFKYCN